ncbi:MAG: hypothetical protein JNM13_07110 [Hyphomicrobiaceae bacterium]|nr:hypothetical protein [Hyphomicrobiaceae bacterium]
MFDLTGKSLRQRKQDPVRLLDLTGKSLRQGKQDPVRLFDLAGKSLRQGKQDPVGLFDLTGKSLRQGKQDSVRLFDLTGKSLRFGKAGIRWCSLIPGPSGSGAGEASDLTTASGRRPFLAFSRVTVPKKWGLCPGIMPWRPRLFAKEGRKARQLRGIDLAVAIISRIPEQNGNKSWLFGAFSCQLCGKF